MTESIKPLDNEHRIAVYSSLVANRIATDVASRVMDSISPMEPVSKAYDILTEVIENLFRLRQEFASNTRSGGSGESS